MQIVQPTVSRVWHIGEKSSIAEDETQKAGWIISALPPWAGHVNHSNHRFNHTLRPGRHDYDGNVCTQTGDSGAPKAACNVQVALLRCQSDPPTALASRESSIRFASIRAWLDYFCAHLIR